MHHARSTSAALVTIYLTHRPHSLSSLFFSFQTIQLLPSSFFLLPPNSSSSSNFFIVPQTILFINSSPNALRTQQINSSLYSHLQYFSDTSFLPRKHSVIFTSPTRLTHHRISLYVHSQHSPKTVVFSSSPSILSPCLKQVLVSIILIILILILILILANVRHSSHSTWLLVKPFLQPFHQFNASDPSSYNNHLTLSTSHCCIKATFQFTFYFLSHRLPT